ncbi:MAG TPA: hypothetical protein VM432_01210, partial [Bdellovibrionales bacterium]|nr:hypothetical protein [Bdellovibrionales bacterium]
MRRLVVFLFAVIAAWLIQIQIVEKAEASPPALSNAPLAEFSFPDAIGPTTQEHVLNAYKRALAVAKPNALKSAIEELKRDLDGAGVVNEPTTANVL